MPSATTEAESRGVVARLYLLPSCKTDTIIHDPEIDVYSETLWCHDQNSEIYYVNFARDRLSFTSYSDDAILAKVDTWADTVTALA